MNEDEFTKGNADKRRCVISYLENLGKKKAEKDDGFNIAMRLDISLKRSNLETASIVEVSNDPDLLIAAQPTRGLDVGAIEFVHKALIEQRDNDKAVFLISFELDEIMNVSDRIAVIYEGKIVGIVDAKDAEVEKLGLMMAGGGNE